MITGVLKSTNDVIVDVLPAKTNLFTYYCLTF